MYTTITSAGPSSKDTLKQQLIATVAAGNSLAAEELKLLLKVAKPETLRGRR